MEGDWKEKGPLIQMSETSARGGREGGREGGTKGPLIQRAETSAPDVTDPCIQSGYKRKRAVRCGG